MTLWQRTAWGGLAGGWGSGLQSLAKGLGADGGWRGMYL